MIIGSIKEDLALEKRVSLTPETAKNIIGLGLNLCLEKDYAIHLGIQDSEYKNAGISKIVALRGDLPSGMGGTKQLVYANELVELIKDHFGDSFEIFVAAYPEIHPESENYQKDIYWLNKKFEAGASRGITQYFYKIDYFNPIIFIIVNKNFIT